MGCKVTEKAAKPKTKHRKGLWSPEEDRRLRDCILKHGHGCCWSSVPAKAGNFFFLANNSKAGLQRNGKSCRLRWINYLRPGLKRGLFTLDEEDTILSLHRMLGNKWSQIAQHLPGRTDNEIKNYWHTYLKKKVAKPEPVQTRKKGECNSDVMDSSSFEEPRHGLSWNPAGPTGVSTLPRSILFTEWLPQYSNMNDNAHGGSFSGHYHCYEDNNLIRMMHMESMDFNTNLLPDSALQNATFGEHDHANRAVGGEELIDGSYMKMEDQCSVSGFLLDCTSKDYIYNSNEFTMSSNTMYI